MEKIKIVMDYLVFYNFIVLFWDVDGVVDFFILEFVGEVYMVRVDLIVVIKEFYDFIFGFK